jgi:hypothetical protein
MKTILRNLRNGTYFQGIEDWTTNPSQAFDFKGTDRAIRFVRDAGLKHMEVVFAFEDPQYDVHLPIDERFNLKPPLIPGEKTAEKYRYAA